MVAFVLTLVSAVYQRMTGPTYPVRGSVTLGGQTYRLRLERTHVTSEDQAINGPDPDQAVQGEVKWRRFPTNEPHQTIPLARTGEFLEAALPKQPAAGKLEYQLLLRRGVELQLFPAAARRHALQERRVALRPDPPHLRDVPGDAALDARRPGGAHRRPARPCSRT